ncbi:MAG TPA: pilus assembly protein TadG-related protein [Gaiellales bacterium]|nr:pilus assembly protein TadG-related protein [Gaiellales bacterium]
MSNPCRSFPLPFSAARRAGRESGQTLVLTVLFMVGLLGVCALTIDVGNLYEQRRQTQSAADAAALAGAAAIPSGSYTAEAQREAGLNDRPGDQVAVSYNGTDSVTVKVTRQAPSFFLGVFGIKTVTVSASATATIQATAQIQGHISPYAVTRDAYANGTGTQLFQENSPGAYGTIDLPALDNTSGGSCGGGNIVKGTPTNIRAILGDTQDVGQLVNQGCISVKSGASQPSADVVNNLPGSFATDLKPTGNGEYQLIPQAWDDHYGFPPRLMYVPIVDSLPNGNGTTTITGFAWFYMTGASSHGRGLVINGQYVTMQLPVNGQTVPYVPGMQGQIVMVGLTA